VPRKYGLQKREGFCDAKRRLPQTVEAVSEFVAREQSSAGQAKLMEIQKLFSCPLFGNKLV
jgi:hypothetical protein